MEDKERLSRLEAESLGLKEDLKELKDYLNRLIVAASEKSKEILGKLENMEDRMERRMVESARTSSDQHNKIEREIKDSLKTVEARVEALEKWRWYIVGVSAASGFLLANLSTFRAFMH